MMPPCIEIQKGVFAMGQKESRVYGKKIDIRPDEVQAFYDKRAQSMAEREEAYTTVLLGDQDPSAARRWAETVAPLCGDYVGVDFSADMIRYDEQHFAAPPFDRCTFCNLSFEQAMQAEAVTSQKYDAVIITGVSMYINDDALRTCYEGLAKLLAPGAIVYIEESAAVRERLSLDHIWSEALKDDYAAIYRTREEYQELLAPLLAVCDVIEDDYMHVVDKEEYTETTHWYTILQFRGAAV